MDGLASSGVRLGHALNEEIPVGCDDEAQRFIDCAEEIRRETGEQVTPDRLRELRDRHAGGGSR